MRRALLALAAALAVAACDLPTASIPPRVVVLRRTPPTPGAVVTQSFLLALRNGAPGADSLEMVLDSSAVYRGLRLARDAGAPHTDSLVVATDSLGLASATIVFGHRSGHAVIRLRGVATGTLDSVVYDLANGTVARVTANAMVPVYAGETTVVGYSTYDAGWHSVFGDPVVSVADTTVATLTGDAVFAKTVGYTWLRVSQSGSTDSAPLAVVPFGRLGAVVSSTWTRFETNGVLRTPVFSTGAAFGDPRLSPSGDTLAYTDGPNIQMRVPGPVTHRLVPAALGFLYDRQPAWSSDGQWLYFTAVYADGRTEIWRIHPDGTGAALAGPAAAAGQHDREPSPSADGTLLAFTTDRTTIGGQNTLRVITVATGATLYSGPAATAPRFAPSGTTLAYLAAGVLTVSGADGSSARTPAPSVTLVVGQIAWSPDGQWIVVAHSDGPGIPPYLHLVQAATGLVVRLPYAFGWALPDWR